MIGNDVAVTVGGATARDVAVAFVDGDRLPVSGLLGMSFLQDFVVTIDDRDSLLTLRRKEPSS